MSVSPYADKELQIRAAITRDLRSRWQPHKGQIPCRNALRDPACLYVFLQCGRKFGKTDWELNELVENCLLPRNRGEVNYYVAYEEEQAKEIAWLEQRALRMCDPFLVEKVYETEMRIVYKNGRHLLHTGSNNTKAARGKQPSMVAMDEFADFYPQFWENMEPNLSVFNAQAVFAGSPPETECQYTEVADMVKELQAHGEGFFTRQPSWMNDKVPGLIRWLEKRKQIYLRRGDEVTWNREYGAFFIPGGKRRIFPNFDRHTCAKSRKWMIENVKKHCNQFNWYVIADPAAASVFCVMFVAVQPDTKDIYVVDGIYERDRRRTASSLINDAIKEKCREWNASLEDWMFFYDDHEVWFQNESERLKEAPPWQPTGKYTRTKDSGISTVKDAIDYHKLWVNVELAEYFNEFESYITDEKGNIPKGRDHYIDCTRYLIIVSHWEGYKLEEEEIPEHIRNDPWLLQAIKTEEDIESEELLDDWTHDMFRDWQEVQAW